MVPKLVIYLSGGVCTIDLLLCGLASLREHPIFTQRRQAAKKFDNLIPQLLPRNQIIPDIIHHRIIQWRYLGGIPRISKSREISLRVVLILFAKMLRHLDELDVLWHVERIEDRLS